MAIINQKWPADLCPETCDFGRSRNDVLQTSPRTRQTTVIRQGRPLWTARLSWSLPQCSPRLEKLRYWLEALDGHAGSVQIWNFACPGDPAQSAGAEIDLLWTEGGSDYAWTHLGADITWSFALTAAVVGSVAAGQTALNVSGFLPDAVALTQGQYLQIGRRIYISAGEVISDGSGQALVTLATPLVSDVADGAAVVRYQPACEMRLAEPSFDERAVAGQGLVSISATFIETVSDFSA